MSHISLTQQEQVLLIKETLFPYVGFVLVKLKLVDISNPKYRMISTVVTDSCVNMIRKKIKSSDFIQLKNDLENEFRCYSLIENYQYNEMLLDWLRPVANDPDKFFKSGASFIFYDSFDFVRPLIVEMFKLLKGNFK